MNCFEARQDFRSFWRKQLAPDRRAVFRSHLSECSKCDGAFRTFALTAPVLHSEAEPLQATPMVRRISAAGSPQRRLHGERRRASAWFAIAAVLALFVTGASAAYFSVETPVETLSDAIQQPSQSVELVSAEFPETNSDFGQ